MQTFIRARPCSKTASMECNNTPHVASGDADVPGEYKQRQSRVRPLATLPAGQRWCGLEKYTTGTVKAICHPSFPSRPAYLTVSPWLCSTFYCPFPTPSRLPSPVQHRIIHASMFWTMSTLSSVLPTEVRSARRDSTLGPG